MWNSSQISASERKVCLYSDLYCHFQSSYYTLFGIFLLWNGNLWYKSLFWFKWARRVDSKYQHQNFHKYFKQFQYPFELVLYFDSTVINNQINFYLATNWGNFLGLLWLRLVCDKQDQIQWHSLVFASRSYFSATLISNSFLYWLFKYLQLSRMFVSSFTDFTANQNLKRISNITTNCSFI